MNSNPATIMTDPETADRTYIEPITVESVTKVIEKERPDALLPNMGGQTGLNCAVALGKAGILEKYGVEVIGCDVDSIETGEDRELFANAMRDIGLEVAKSGIAHTVEECEKIADELGYPVVLRPAFTLGGAGGGMAYDHDDLVHIAEQGLALSPESEVLVEQSVEGWKEIEMEVMRDSAGNGVVICSIENLDPMGVHTGDSITVAPCQTLNDFELQRLRDYSLAILERVGVACGGSNVQFAVNPNDGRVIVIEMNPRVSRSSALASKATGFPIAKMAALLSVGYTLDEIENDITRETPACFEPSIDYCVVKVPRFAFEKFKGTDDTLTTRMKAVGEIMAIGRTFEEAFGKAMRSLEDGREDSRHIPVCPVCGGPIKPDVVLYGEALDDRVVEGALAAIASADLLVVGGTSLVVYPAAGLIRYFGGDTLVIVNRDPTPQDSLSDVLISCDIAKAFDF